MYMPEHEERYGLCSADGEIIPLQSVKVEVVFNNLLCETAMTQVYRNRESNPIEAVYTFPLTSRAVLLGMTITIGDRELRGVAVGKAKAEEEYEEAVTGGDTAIMLEQVQSGLYTMNVGNILAGEEVQVKIRYAELYSWLGDTIRFHLPTTIAPRYGIPESAGLQPHQIPEADLLTENRFQLSLTLTGTLTGAKLDCPSHQVAIAHARHSTVVTLAGGEACMDRDFILNISLANTEKDSVLLERDLDGGFVALASFTPKLLAPEEPSPRSIKIVVDCSGSMDGDSITQARQAISDILSQLRPEDFFNLITFGSTCDTCFDRQLPANSENITRVRRLLRSLEANMGGTEMRQALQAAVRLPGPSILQDILLITDGEVWESDEIIPMMKKSGHRVFTVGVGSSVSEGFVRNLAKETGGKCELVVPNEGMTEKIVRHFRRIFLPRAEDITVRWPVEPVKVTPRDVGPVFADDTLHVFAFFNERLRGQVSLEVTMPDGMIFSQAAKLEDIKTFLSGDDLAGPLVRMAIYQSLVEKDEKEATELALQYQLLSSYTNFLIVDVRTEGEKGKGLPNLRKVRQMLAAGWGGTGMVVREEIAFSHELNYDRPSFLKRMSKGPPQDGYDRPKFAKRVPMEQPLPSQGLSPEQIEEARRRQHLTTPSAFARRCSVLHKTFLFWPVLQIAGYNDLLACALPNEILLVLEAIAGQCEPKAQEEQVALAFLFVLANSVVGQEFNRKTQRAIKRAVKNSKLDDRLLKLMTEAFAGISNDAWGPKYHTTISDD